MDEKISQLGFFRFYQTIIWNAAKRAWNKFGGLGTFIGIIVPIIAVIIARQPKSFSEFWGEDAVITAYLIVGLFALVILFYISREPVTMYNKEASDKELANKRLDEMSETQPNVVFDSFGNEMTQLTILKPNQYGVQQKFRDGDLVERFYIAFRNDKKRGVKTETAEDIYANITFYDSEKPLGIRDNARWWGAYSPGDIQAPYKPINIRPSGRSQKLYLSIRKVEQEKLYIFGEESYNSQNFIVDRLELKSEIHYIHIRLSADNMDIQDYWVKMQSNRKEKPHFTLLDKSPEGLKGIDNEYQQEG